jgi:hypothetical protein
MRIVTGWLVGAALLHRGALAAPATSATATSSADVRRLVDAAAQAGRRAEALRRRHRTREAAAEEDRALAAYSEALRLSNDANLRLPLALLEERRGHRVAAAEQLRKIAVASGVRANVARTAAAHWTELTTHLSQLTFTVKPDRTVVQRGAMTVGVSPLTESMLLEPGSYTFRFAADGYRTKELTIDIGAGEDNERTVELYPLAPLSRPAHRLK